MESNQSNQSNQVVTQVVYGPITVDKVDKGQFTKAGFMQATLRQVVTRYDSYPTARVGNSLSDSLFAESEFSAIERKDFENKETRIAWMDVPEGTTVKDVEERLKLAKTARLYKILSNAPILTKEQLSSIERGQKTMDDFAKTQVVRYSPGTMKNGVDVSGQVIPDPNGNVQYKVNHFSSVGADDIDSRTTNKEAHYVSPEIKAELVGASVIAGQTV